MIHSRAALSFLAGSAYSANLPGTLNTGSTYAGTYDVPGTLQSSTAGGPGTVDFTGTVNAGSSGSKLSWLVQSGHQINYAASAQYQGNTAGLINARAVEWVGVGVNAPQDHVVEFDAGFNADLGSQAAKAGGLSSAYFYNLTLITHATQNLASVWKYTTDKTGVQHDTHHGLMQFYSPFYYKNDSTRSTIWQIRSNDQTSDLGSYWRGVLTMDVAAGLTFSSNTWYEQSVVGPHVGFGTRNAEANTTFVKTGAGNLVIARAGIQGYGDNTTMDIQAGKVEFNSDPTQLEANYYLRNTTDTPTLHVDVASGATVDFNAYTWPDNTNWWSGSGGTHGVNNRHRVASVDSNGVVQVGGLWVATADALDQHYKTMMDAVAVETATAGDAFLQVADHFNLSATATLDLTLGSAAPSAGIVDVAGGAVLDGALQLAMESGFTPGMGTQIVLLDSAATVGTFDQILGTDMGGGKALAVTYEGNKVLATTAWAGDTNLDGTVDFSDFLVLQTRFGTSGSWIDGDFDGSGVVDIDDFFILEAGVGSATASETAVFAAFAAANIPEPGSAAILGLTGLALLGRRRRAA